MLPCIIKPMEPVIAQEPPARNLYLHSVKWDGVRQIVFLEEDNVRIHNRKLKDRTLIYPELHRLKGMVSGTGVVFDGEVIALNENGQPDFSRVMRRDNCKSEASVKAALPIVPVFYMIFDLLFYKGESIMDLPLSSRLEILNEVLPDPTAPIQLVEHLQDGQQLFQRTKELGLEGVVSKDSTSRYMPGTKSRIWVKSKHYKDMIVVVGGFTVKNGTLNSLSVGAYGKDDALHYLGNVATGLSQRDIAFLNEYLRKSIRAESPFAEQFRKSQGQYWTEPDLAIKVKYLEFTNDGHLRHPVIMGFVSAKPKECRY